MGAEALIALSLISLFGRRVKRDGNKMATAKEDRDITRRAILTINAQ